MTVSLDELSDSSRSAREAIRKNFDTLFEAHWDRVVTVVYRMVGDWDEAEDISVEVFLRLYQRQVDHLENLDGWLYRVATRLGLNAIRSRKNRQKYELEAGRTALENNHPVGPADAVEKIEAAYAVRQVLGQIRPKYARLLVLRYSGFSYREIAGVLRISPNSVGTLLVRAEKAFARQYRQTERRE